MSCPTDPKDRDDLGVPPKPMRRGALSERYVKCSKKGCACAESPDARHGPYYSLTRGSLRDPNGGIGWRHVEL